jgi:hypothetical protein
LETRASTLGFPNFWGNADGAKDKIPGCNPLLMIGCNAALKFTEFAIHFLTGFTGFTGFQPRQKFRVDPSLGGRAELSLGGQAELSLGGRAELSLGGRAELSLGGRAELSLGGRAQSRPSDTWSAVETIRPNRKLRKLPLIFF